jgi:hypothetical protein
LLIIILILYILLIENSSYENPQIFANASFYPRLHCLQPCYNPNAHRSPGGHVRPRCSRYSNAITDDPDARGWSDPKPQPYRDQPKPHRSIPD